MGAMKGMYRASFCPLASDEPASVCCLSNPLPTPKRLSACSPPAPCHSSSGLPIVLSSVIVSSPLCSLSLVSVRLYPLPGHTNGSHRMPDPCAPLPSPPAQLGFQGTCFLSLSLPPSSSPCVNYNAAPQRDSSCPCETWWTVILRPLSSPYRGLYQTRFASPNPPTLTRLCLANPPNPVLS